MATGFSQVFLAYTSLAPSTAPCKSHLDPRDLYQIDGLVQDYSNFIAVAMELL